MRKYESGYAKRLKKRQRLEGDESLPKIVNYFARAHPTQPEPAQEIVAVDDSISEEQEQFSTRHTESTSASENVICPELAGDTTEAPVPDDDCSTAKSFMKSLQTFRWPNDIANFADVPMTNELKKFILKHPPCQPTGPFQTDETGRTFRNAYYVQTLENGLTLRRTWLQFSKVLNKAYCLPCWLFPSGIQNSWQSGFSDFKHISQAILRHEESQFHLSSCSTLRIFQEGATIGDILEKENSTEISFWKQVIKRLIDVIIMLSTQNLALRGHREVTDLNLDAMTNTGNFLAVARLLSKYDPVMTDLKNFPGKLKYLSNTSQNELIQCISESIRDQICNEVNSAMFYSIIFDTTQDVSKVDQGSLVIRYIHLKKASDGVVEAYEIKEAFLGFIEVSSGKAEYISKLIQHTLSSFGISFEKLRGMGFDGARNMSGHINGLQAKLKEQQPLALYVHCLAHNVSLLIRDVVRAIPELDEFFYHMEQLYLFFSSSLPRWSMLKLVKSGMTPDEAAKLPDHFNDAEVATATENAEDSTDGCLDLEAFSEMDTDVAHEHEEQLEHGEGGEGESEKTTAESDNAPANAKNEMRQKRKTAVALKKLCETRWEDHLKSLVAVKENYGHILVVLEYLSDSANKVEIRLKSKNLYKYFTKFETIVICHIEYKKLVALNSCSKAFQSPKLELGQAALLLKKAKDAIQQIKVDDVLMTAEESARSLDIDPIFNLNKKRKTSRPKRLEQFDTQYASGERSEGSEEQCEAKAAFVAKVLQPNIQKTLQELERRFSSTSEINSLFGCLLPENLIKFSDSELESSSSKLCERYPADISTSLTAQLLSLRMNFQNDLKVMKSPTNLLDFLLGNNGILSCAYAVVISALILFLTLPVSVGGAERSFSKLKLIKNYLRNTISQSRLSGLALISIERDRALKLDNNAVTKRFFDMKDRRKR